MTRRYLSSQWQVTEHAAALPRSRQQGVCWSSVDVAVQALKRAGQIFFQCGLNFWHAWAPHRGAPQRWGCWGGNTPRLTPVATQVVRWWVRVTPTTLDSIDASYLAHEQGSPLRRSRSSGDSMVTCHTRNDLAQSWWVASPGEPQKARTKRCGSRGGTSDRAPYQTC